MSLKSRATFAALLMIFAICAIGLLPAAARAVLFSRAGTSPTLSFTSLANGSVSSTVAGSGAYTVAAPSGLTGATWGGGCSGSSTVTGFSASAGTWSATFSTPSGAGTGCTLAATGTGSNTATATSPGVTISSGGGGATVVSVTIAASTLMPPAGISVSSGNLLMPSGARWHGYGVAVSDTDATNFGAGLTSTLQSQYPGINLVRLAVAPTGSGPFTWAAPASLAPFVNAATAAHIAVVIENHDDNNSVYTGSTLTGESAWYASLAAYYLGNSYVMFQTMNEPGAGDSAQMTATYTALRGTGYSGVIFIEAGQGAGGISPASTSLGSTTFTNSMTNVAWDLHCYAWQTSGQSTLVSVPTIQSDQNSRITTYQAVTSASGTMPVITLETGISTNGSSVDTSGDNEVTASFSNTSLQGASAWAWDNFQGANSMTSTFGGSLNTYGTFVSGIISGNPGSAAILSGTGLLTSASGSKTATATITFSASVTASGSNVLNLSDSISCPIGTGTGISLTASCTFTSGSDTPTSGKNTYLGTAATGAITGGTISNGSGGATLTGANGITFTGLSVNTHATYFIAANGNNTGSGTGACQITAPCATLNFVRGLVEANSTKVVYARAGGGSYSPSSTCTWVSDQGSHPTVTTVLCLTSADTNTAWLGYPGESPTFNGGATNSSNGVNDVFYLSGGIRGAIINGLTMNNFTFGFIEGNNAGATITNNVGNGLFQPSGSTDSYGFVGMFEQINNLDVEYNLIMNTQGAGIVVISDSSGSIGVGGTNNTVAHNILLNTCLSLSDCGALYAYDQSHTMTGCTWADNIIGNFGPTSTLSSAIYFDDYMSNCSVKQNQIYADGNSTNGQPAWAVHWHGGNLLLVNSNLIDMSGTFSAVSSHNPDVHYYQSATSGAGGGYNGDMDSNQFEDNIVYSSVAPFTSSCVGSSTLNCGYLWIWEFDGGTTIDNPTVSGNAYHATTGSFTNLGSNPSQSSGTFGPITESGAFAGNPGVSFSTSAGTCGFGPAVPSGTRCYAASNPPGLSLLTGQGPH